MLNAFRILYVIPPIGDAKQLDTPRAQAAARISVLRDSFYKRYVKKFVRLNECEALHVVVV